jgi:hypothetical protein
VRYPSAARDYVIDEVKDLFRERVGRKTGDGRARGRGARDSRKP